MYVCMFVCVANILFFFSVRALEGFELKRRSLGLFVGGECESSNRARETPKEEGL